MNVGVQQVPVAAAVSTPSMSPLVALDERASDRGMLHCMMRTAFYAGLQHRATEKERQQEQGRQASGKEPGPSERPIEGPNERPSEGPSEGVIEGPREGTTEGPTEGPIEGPNDRPSEGPNEGPSELNEQLTQHEAPRPALGSPTGSPHVSTAQANLTDRSADTPMTTSSHGPDQRGRGAALQQVNGNTSWDQLVADLFGLLMHLFASSLASQCSSPQQAWPWAETRDVGSSPGNMAIALQKPAAFLQVDSYIVQTCSLRLWYICARTTSCSQISNHLMHSMHMHCTCACQVTLQHQASLKFAPAHLFDGVHELGA